MFSVFTLSANYNSTVSNVRGISKKLSFRKFRLKMFKIYISLETLLHFLVADVESFHLHLNYYSIVDSEEVGILVAYGRTYTTTLFWILLAIHILNVHNTMIA